MPWMIVLVEESTGLDWRLFVTRWRDEQSRKIFRSLLQRIRVGHCGTDGRPDSTWLRFVEASTIHLLF